MTDWKTMTDIPFPDKPLPITLVQQNYLLADLAGNAAQISAAVRAVEQRHPHSLIVFSELSLTGYPPEDLLLRPEFLQNTQQALLALAQQVHDSYVVVGLPLLDQGRLYNMACVLHDGQVIAQYGKQHLPNYSVFDEKRYFTAGDQPCVLDIQGYRVGLTICEDLWQPGPLGQAVQAGAELIVCLNASPFHLHKPKERMAALRARQQAEGRLPIVYVNMVGGQDELVFDGGSMVIDAQGQVAAQCDYFTNDQLTVTFSARQGVATDRALPIPSSGTGDIYQALVLGTRDYVRKNNFTHVVLGLSGGIDSALTLAVAVDALGAPNVHAVMLPSRYTSDMSVEDAKQLSEQAGVSYDIISIEPAFTALLTSLDDMFAGAAVDVTEENLQSRCRAALLMAISNKFGWLVLNTGNKSEMAVGYATLYGDMAGAFAVLKDVPKTLVYELAHYRNQQSALIPSRIIERPPSAELAVDQVDQDWLPPYAILDPIITHYVEHNRSIADIVAQGFDPTTVKYVVHLIQRNEYKRRQAPPGVKISQRAFGRDWRVPITAFY
jgi:NAD+ synthase (glutamine-hydrolysing)